MTNGEGGGIERRKEWTNGELENRKIIIEGAGRQKASM
jgi:hypothetical protein